MAVVDVVAVTGDVVLVVVAVLAVGAGASVLVEATAVAAGAGCGAALTLILPAMVTEPVAPASSVRVPPALVRAAP